MERLDYCCYVIQAGWICLMLQNLPCITKVQIHHTLKENIICPSKRNLGWITHTVVTCTLHYLNVSFSERNWNFTQNKLTIEDSNLVVDKTKLPAAHITVEF